MQIYCANKLSRQIELAIIIWFAFETQGSKGFGLKHIFEIHYVVRVQTVHKQFTITNISCEHNMNRFSDSFR